MDINSETMSELVNDIPDNNNMSGKIRNTIKNNYLFRKYGDSINSKELMDSIKKLLKMSDELVTDEFVREEIKEEKYIMKMALVCNNCKKMYICLPDDGKEDIKNNTKLCDQCYFNYLDSIINVYIETVEDTFLVKTKKKYKRNPFKFKGLKFFDFNFQKIV